MSNKTGGPAFPVFNYEGMTLRDYFAAKVVMGFASYSGRSDETTTARFAYDMADAMIKAREE